MGVGPSVLTDARDLPGYLHAGFSAGNLELVIGHFLRNIHRREAADAGELVAEVTVERLELVGELDDRRTACIQRDYTVVDVHHVGRFDKGMREILIRRVHGMVYPERPTGLGNIACNLDIA